MSTATTTETRPATADEVCRQYKPSDDALGLLGEEVSPAAFLDRLIRAERYADGIQFLARWLTRQEAVWWGCLCAWEACRPSPPQEADDALKAAVAWVLEPTEKNRQACRAHAKQAGTNTPAGCVALAAFYSGGSISLPGLPHVAAPEGSTAKQIAGAVALAASRATPVDRKPRQQTFLRLGLEIVNGKSRWE